MKHYKEINTGYRIKSSQKEGYYYSIESDWDINYQVAWSFLSEDEALDFVRMHLENENIIIEKYYNIKTYGGNK
jgi:hypothetical protein